MSQFMNQHYKFEWEDMLILTDDQQNPMSQPIRANILGAMRWLVQDARPNDNLFFHYSGHRGHTENLEGDKGYDQTIYPLDFKSMGVIVDKDIRDILVQLLPAGCRLTAIFDCCYVGSALDLPYEYVNLIVQTILIKGFSRSFKGAKSSH
jgi:metacaspase-1